MESENLVEPRPMTEEEEGRPLRSVCALHTLEDSLEAFGLLEPLQEQENSLKDVRRRKITAEEHKAKFEAFDEEIQNMSRIYHPDRIANNGGTGEDVSRADEMQTALNATRMVLNMLNKTFLEDIDVDLGYQFFKKLDIRLLRSEDELDYRISEVLLKIRSRVKEERIVVVIKKFLTAAQFCVRSCIEQRYADFEKESSFAFHYLARCICEYKKFLAEFLDVEEARQSEEGDYMFSLKCGMRKNYLKQLKHLEALSERCNHPIGKRWEFYSCPKNMDNYYVLPFVHYINVIMTCRLMIEGEKAIDETDCDQQSHSTSKDIKFFSSMMSGPILCFSLHQKVRCKVRDLFYLASYYSGDKQYEKLTRELLKAEQKTEVLETGDVIRFDIEKAFVKNLIELLDLMRLAFKFEMRSDVKWETEENLDLALKLEELQSLRECLVSPQGDSRTNEDQNANESADISTKLEEFQSLMETLVVQVGELRSDVTQKTDENVILSQKLVELQSLNESLASQQEVLRIDVSRKADENADLSEKLKEFQSLNESLESRREELRSVANRLTDENANLLRELEELRSRNDSLVSQQDLLSRDVNRNTNASAELSKKLEEFQSLNVILLSQQELRNDVKQKADEIEDLWKRLKKEESVNACLGTRQGELMNDVLRKTDELKNQSNQIEELQSYNESLLSEKEQLRTDLDRAMNQIADLTKKLQISQL